MTVAIDQITRRKLILVKQIYQNALVQSTAAHSAVNRILSIIAFDLANETILKAVISSFDTSKPPAKDIPGLIQQADDLLTKGGHDSVPDKANIYHVHSLRNDAQHKAKYPNEWDVSDCRTYTRDFLQKFSKNIWGIEFDKVSLTDTVENDEVRAHLVNGELAFSQGEYLQAIKHAALGLTLALNRVKAGILGRDMPIFARGIAMVDGLGNPASRLDAERAYRAFERVQETLLYVSLGMNYVDFMRYRQIVGEIIFTIDGSAHYLGTKENLEAHEAEFVVAFCADSVARIESQVGNLNKPFGMGL